MGIILLLSAWLLLKHKTSAVIAMAAVTFFILQREYSWYRYGKQRQLIVYNINRYTAIDIIQGHTATFYGDKECIDSTEIFRNTIGTARMFLKVNRDELLQKDTSGFEVIEIGGKKLLVLDKEPDLRNSGTIKADWLLIATNLKARPAWVLDKISTQTIIAGTKLPAYKVEQWHSAVDSLHLRLHSVREDGAYIFKFMDPK
jgi:competence protein ComEC